MICNNELSITVTNAILSKKKDEPHNTARLFTLQFQLIF